MKRFFIFSAGIPSGIILGAALIKKPIHAHDPLFLVAGMICCFWIVLLGSGFLTKK